MIKKYIVGLKNEPDGSIDYTIVSIPNFSNMRYLFMKHLNDVYKEENDIRTEIPFDLQAKDRNTLTNLLQDPSLSGFFVFISHFWLFCDGENLYPLSDLI